MSVSIARGAPRRPTLSPWPQNDVERNIWRANALAASVVVAIACFGWVTTRLLDGRTGDGLAIGDAVGKAMLYTGIPHYVLALLFMITSSANRTPERRLRLIGSCFAALALCGLYAALGGPPLPGTSGYLRQLEGGFPVRILPLTGLVAVYIFFLAHEISDETSFLHHAERQGAEVAAARRLVVRVLFPTIIAFLGAAGWIATAFGAYDGTLAILPPETPFAARFAAALGPLVIVAFLVAVLWRRSTHRDRVDVRRISADLWPELRVCLLTVVTIAAGLIVTSRAYWIFLPHFAVWYMIARQKLPADGSTECGWWRWMRHTRAGFDSMYGFLALTVLLAGSGAAHSTTFSDSSVFLSRGVFVHATIFHITVSFLLPRAH